MQKPSVPGAVGRWNSRTKRDLIIEVWEYLDCESVGARELEQIQRALGERFGDGAVVSPASIARTVADEGAVLRHPEVFECDLKWRRQAAKGLEFQGTLDFTTLSAAFGSMVKVEEKRMDLPNNDTSELTQLRNLVTIARKESLLRARSKIIDPGQREEAREVSEWLSIWLQAPELFSDWLDLRRRSPEFRKKFSTEKSG